MITNLQDLIQYVHDQPDQVAKQLGQLLEEHFPFTPENQHTLLLGQLEANKKKGLEKLLDNLQAERSMPGANDHDLLEQNLAEAVASLKKKSIWQTTRTYSLEEIVERLVSKAHEGMLQQKIRQVLKPDRANRNPVLNFFEMAGNWGQFFITIFDDIDAYAEALMWANYIDFLETELAALNLRSSTHSLSSQNQLSLRFDDYLVSRQQTLIPFLISQLSGQKPKHFATMLFALQELGLIKPTTVSHNQTELHQALKNTFGQVGTRSALNSNIKKLDAANTRERQLINKYKTLIKKNLKL